MFIKNVNNEQGKSVTLKIVDKNTSVTTDI